LQNDEGALFLNEAKELEKGYDWVGAAASYEKAANLALKKEDLFGTAGIYERIGYCFYRAALQAETKKQFESRMKLSAEAYGRLVKHLQRFNGEGKEEKLDHAKGLYAFAKSWIAPDFFKMADLLEEWWKLENKVLAVYEEKGDLLAIGKTCNNLIAYSQGRRIFFSAPEYFERRQELINIGEKAIAVLSKLDDAYELAQAYCSTGFYYGLTGTPVTHDKWRLYSEKAVALSKTSGDQWLIGWAHNAAWIGSGYYDTEFASWLDHAKNIVEAGKVSKDNHLMAVGSWATSLTSAHSMQFEEDPDKQRQTLKKASEWAQQALIHSQLINWPIGILLSQNTYSENLVLSASMETSRKEKRSLLEKAVEVGRKSVQYAEGQPWVHVNVAVDALSKSLFCLAMTETSVKEKTRLLKEALAYRENYASEITTGKKLLISTHAAQALYNLALIQSELARIEAPQEKQIQLFDRAVSFLEKCTEIAEKFAEELPNAITSRYMGFYYYAFGGVLSQVYKLTKKKSKLADALEVYKKAAEHFDKAVLTIHVAECHWQLALLHNLLGEHLEGSQSYALAAKAYKATAEKTPQLKSFCEDYSTYMLAWSEVEKAMHHDSKEEYEESGKCFERAANLFEASRQWSYMAPNYSAWALMENAETESRKENPQSAAEAFGQAFEKFKNAEDTIKRRIAETESPDEKATISRLIKTANLRSSYCQARINIEEAKVHDQKGEYTLSSKSYGLAAETLNRLVGEEVPEQPQQELRLLLKLCRAWAKMEFAEEKASPAIYLEASQLFEEAKEQSLTKKSSLLALGNSSFCKGLAAGTQFQTTLEPAQHSIAKRHMETAATFYLQAGFPSASEYAKAT
jgi:tetratricopeptide (TPR) repeat protein